MLRAWGSPMPGTGLRNQGQQEPQSGRTHSTATPRCPGHPKGRRDTPMHLESRLIQGHAVGAGAEAGLGHGHPDG